MLEDLLDLLGKKERGTVALPVHLETADLLINQCTNFASRIRCDIDGVGIRAHRCFRLVATQDVANPPWAQE